jgi:hypothetical protein
MRIFVTLLLASWLTLAMAGGNSEAGKKKLVGTWLLNGNNKNIRFVFRNDGTFSFASTNATSRGKWSCQDTSVKLVWTEVDKQKVKPGSVKGTFTLLDGTLQVDRFQYRKAG